MFFNFYIEQSDSLSVKHTQTFTDKFVHCALTNHLYGVYSDLNASNESHHLVGNIHIRHKIQPYHLFVLVQLPVYRRELLHLFLDPLLAFT